MDHLKIRNDVHVIHTADEQHTAERLYQLAANMLTIKPSIFGASDSNIDQLNKKHQLDDSGVQEKILKCLPSVGPIVSRALIDAGITFQKIYNGEFTADMIAQLKFPSGASLGIEKARKIVSKTWLTSARCDKKRQSMLSSVPGISKVTASKILAVHSLRSIIDGQVSIETLQNIQRSEKSKLGKKASESIIKYLQCGQNEESETSYESKTEEKLKNVNKSESKEKSKKVNKTGPKKKLTVETEHIISNDSTSVFNYELLPTDDNYPVTPPLKVKRAKKPKTVEEYL